MHVRVEGGGEEGRVCACEGGGGGWGGGTFKQMSHFDCFLELQLPNKKVR